MAKDKESGSPMKGTAMEFPVSFGKVTYAPRAPKNAPRWIWICECQECARLDWTERVHGPFKTRREAERNFAEKVRDTVSGWDGTQH
jgi:hypothetical protein